MRPKIDLDNSAEIYDYYRDHRPNKLANQIGHIGMSLVFRPTVSYGSGAQSKIAQLLNSKTRIILAANHLRFNDQFIIASLAYRERTLRPMTGNTFIPIYKPVLRYGLDAMDAVPTFRAKDILKPDGSVDEVKTLPRKLASKRLIATAIARINDGNNMAIFPEGTRNDESDTNPNIVQKLAPGIGLIACGLDPSVNYALLPVGIFYGHEGKQLKTTKPFVHIGQPIPGPFNTPDDVLQTLHPAMQSCVDQAVESSGNLTN